MSDLSTQLRNYLENAAPPIEPEEVGTGWRPGVRHPGSPTRRPWFPPGLAAAVLVLVTVGLGWLLRPPSAYPVISPIETTPNTLPAPNRAGSKDIFANVHGWIAYGYEASALEPGPAAGIWAVDPTQPGDPNDQIQLSDREGGAPLAWSNDGSKLLIRRLVADSTDDPAGYWSLFVLTADGTETRLLTENWGLPSGSFTPDGSQVVFAAGFGNGIYTVDAGGDAPRLLIASSLAFGVGNPALSPDGTQIAYFEGLGDHSLWDLRVIDTDGSRNRLLVDDALSYSDSLVWSPDGSRLAFSGDDAIWVVGADGSGVINVIPDGVSGEHVYWSPDGSRISYTRIDPAVPITRGTLVIAEPDGTIVEEFSYGASGPWNPLPLSAPASSEPSPTGAQGPLAQSPAEDSPLDWRVLSLAAGALALTGSLWFLKRRRGQQNST